MRESQSLYLRHHHLIDVFIKSDCDENQSTLKLETKMTNLS